MNSWKFFKLMDAAAGDGGSNGGGAGGGGQGAGAAGSKDTTDWKAKFEESQKEIAALKSKETPPEDAGLAAKAKKDQEERERRQGDVRALESAVSFNVNSQTFLKDNAALLPKDAEEIFKLADKEKYDSPVEKASEVKAGLIHSYFSIQANLDLLTASQKTTIADFLKLSKTGRQEKAQQVFESIFEPTLESARRIKKAEQLAQAKNGFGDGSDEPYKQKLIAGSLKHYTGVTKNA